MTTEDDLGFIDLSPTHHEYQAARHLEAVEGLGDEAVGDPTATHRMRLAGLHIALAHSLRSGPTEVKRADPLRQGLAGAPSPLGGRGGLETGPDDVLDDPERTYCLDAAIPHAGPGTRLCYLPHGHDGFHRYRLGPDASTTEASDV